MLGAITVQVFGCVDREIYIDRKEGRKDRYSGPGAGCRGGSGGADQRSISRLSLSLSASV